MMKEIIALSILSNISKIYKRLSYKQLETYFESILSQDHWGFGKGFSVLTTVLPIVKRRELLDSGGNFEALLTDLSKASGCLSHDLPLSKLHVLN